jgi:hypothetical protein
VGAGAVYTAIVQRMSQLIVGELTSDETYDRLAADVAAADAARKANKAKLARARGRPSSAVSRLRRTPSKRGTAPGPAISPTRRVPPG